MLFSNDRISKLINDSFVPVWQSVRPVPKVTIDFGNGRTINRTLHGNIATYICSPSGHVIDDLPGLYSAEVYEQQLTVLRSAAAMAPKTEKGFTNWLKARHSVRLQRMAPPDIDGLLGKVSVRDVPKAFVVELPLITALKPVSDIAEASESVNASTIDEALRLDARINDSARRKQVSVYLKDAGSVTPDSMTKWLYREVLNADIDDPWLGLKDLADAAAFRELDSGD